MQELLIDGDDLEKQMEGFRQLIQSCWEEAPERRPIAREVRLELADHQLQHLTPSPTVAAASSSSIPIPLYTFGSNR